MNFFLIGLSTILFSVGAFAECTDFPQVKMPLFETALRNLLSLDYVRHAIESDRSAENQFCTQSIILGHNDYKYGLFYFRIVVVNTKTNATLRTFNFLYQDASTQANHNSRFFNWVGLSLTDAKKDFDNLMTAAVYYQPEKGNALTQTTIVSEDSSESIQDKMKSLIKISHIFSDSADDDTTLSYIQLSSDTYLFTWLNKSDNSFARSQLLNSVLVKVEQTTNSDGSASGQKFQLSPNKFLYSELRMPLYNDLVAARNRLTDINQAADYIRAISKPTSTAATDEDIVQVIVRSKNQDLAQLQDIDSSEENFKILKKSVNDVMSVQRDDLKIELKIIKSLHSLVATNMLGHVLVLNENLMQFTEDERRFIIAHEIAHLAHKDWDVLLKTYKYFIPGRVTQEQTDKIASALGSKLSQLSYDWEFNADLSAFETLVRMGIELPAAKAAAIAVIGKVIVRDTATHPGTTKRIMAVKQFQLSKTIMKN